jgi:acetolactate decarboxylase
VTKNPTLHRTLMVAVAALMFVLSGCAGGAARTDGEETLTQVSTIDALLAGVYDGAVTFETLGDYGDFGIGTFATLDGEMLAFDGNFYQVKSDGRAYPVTDDMETPFSAVTFFDEDFRYAVPEGLDLPEFATFLDEKLDSVNAFYAIRIDGTFTHVKTRSVPAQQKPYLPLAEIAATQPVFEFQHVAGTLVGFRCPAFVAGVNVPGYHLHFLTDDKSAGGHVLEFTVAQADVSVDVTRDFLMILPDGASDFYDIDLTSDKEDELEKVEK